MKKIKVSAKKEKCYPQAIVETYSGKMFDVLNPKEELIMVLDIAHSLSNQCRYGGHCKKFYSVAEHSVLVMQILKHVLYRIEHYFGHDFKRVDKTEFYCMLMGALLHDASEGYLVDIPTPVKLRLHNYIEIEKHVMSAIFERFGLSGGLLSTSYDDARIKFSDKVALKKEASILLPSGGKKWLALADFDDNGFPMDVLKIRCLKPKQAEAFFLFNVFDILNEITPSFVYDKIRRHQRNKYYMTRIFGWFF